VNHLEPSVGFVIASEYRKRILRALEKSTMTPSQIAEVTELNRPHVSRFLRELKEAGLVRCDAPDLRKGRLYSITEQGLAVLRRVGSLEARAKA